MSGTHVAYGAIACYAMSGTDVAYGAALARSRYRSPTLIPALTRSILFLPVRFDFAARPQQHTHEPASRGCVLRNARTGRRRAGTVLRRAYAMPGTDVAVTCCQALYALAALNWRDPRVTSHLARVITRAKPRDFTPLIIANLAWACA
eukprot:2065296-Rhodomonas_salina.1